MKTRLFLLNIFLLSNIFILSAIVLFGIPKISPIIESGYIQNKGQWDNNVLFMMQGQKENVWIAKNNITFEHEQITKVNGNLRRKGDVLKFTFSGSNENFNILANHTHSGYFNYILGNAQSKWISGVQRFDELLIENLYDGINLRLYTANDACRYDFILKPNADITKIKFNIEGAAVYRINNDNELEIETSNGLIKHNKMLAWQNIDGKKVLVECKFVLDENNMISISADSYNTKCELIIDPLVFSTYLGSSNADEIYDMQIDNSANVYVCGYTASPSYPTTSGAFDESFNGTNDCFVTKLTPIGSNLIFSTFIGGTSDDRATGLYVDASGDIYISGYTGSTNFPVSSGAYDETFNGDYDAFATKLSSDGKNIRFSTYIGGTIYDQANDIAVDDNKNVYITGKTFSNDFPVTLGAYDMTFENAQDIFVSCFNSDGTLLRYSTYLGGTDIDIANRMDIDGFGNIYVVGESSSADFPVTPGAYDMTFNGGIDIILFKMNSSLSNLIFSTYIGGGGNEKGKDIILDNSIPYICGETISANYPTSFDAYDQSYNGGNDGIVSKLDASGSTLTYSTFLGGAANDALNAIALDNTFAIYVSGTTNSNNFPVSANAFDLSFNGGDDAVLSKLNPTGTTLVYSTFLGGASTEESKAVKIDGGKNVLLSGMSMSNDFPTSLSAYDQSYNGQIDGFITKVTGLDAPTISTGDVTHVNCAGDEIDVNFVVSADFSSGNIFSAQLSNENGSFVSPINIGNLTGTSSGIIIAHLPKNAIYGTGYRIRVVANNPIVTGTDNGSNITINEIPDVSITGEPQPCVNETNTYSADAASNMIYRWSVSGGSIQGDSTRSNVNIQWDNTESGIVQLIQKNNLTGCADTARAFINILPAPETAIAFGKYEVCVGEIAEYTVASSTIAANQWNVSGGSLQNGTDAARAYVLWTSEGDGFIELVKTDEYGCIGRDKKTVTVNPIPTVQITGNTIVISGKNSQYKSNFLSGTKCLWWVKGGVIQQDSTSDSVLVLWGKPGKGELRLVKYFSATDCSDTLTKSITINPGLPSQEIQGKDEVCDNSIEEYSTGEVQNTYIKWKASGGKIIGADNGFTVQVNWTDAGSALIKYILTDIANGNKDSLSKEIIVYSSPAVTFEQLDDVCENDNPFELSGGTPSGGNYSGAGVDLDNFYPDRAGAGTHEITYTFTDNSSGCKTSVIQNIIVFPKPETPVITQKGDTLFSGNDSGNQWFKDGNLIEGANGNYLIWKDDGVYSLQVTDSNGCKSDMNDIEISVEEYSEDNQIEIYPNPAQDILFIKMPASMTSFADISILDIYGKQIPVSYFKPENNIKENLIYKINISGINTGFYLLKISIGANTLIEKVIISR